VCDMVAVFMISPLLCWREGVLGGRALSHLSRLAALFRYVIVT
jgi:hypothetical protein